MNPPNRNASLVLLVSLFLSCGANVTVAVDCNSNGVEDATDIAGATSMDANSNAVPDECDLKIGLTFAGPDDDNENPPPDPTLAVGPNHIVSTINAFISVYDLAGVELASGILNDDDSQQTEPGFFEEVGAGVGVFDPRCLYDQFADRFLVVALDLSPAPQDRPLFVAVSKTGIPTDLSTNGWHKYRLPASIILEGEILEADFPGLGVDKNAIYVTYFFESEGTDDAVASRIRVIDKAAVLSGVKNLFEGQHYHDFFLPDRYVIQPAHTFGDAPAEYFVTSKCARSSVPCTTDGFEVIAVTGAPANPVLTTTTITTPEYSAPAVTGTGKNRVPEGPVPPGKKIDGGDWAPYNATWRDGNLYTAHTIDSDGDLDDPVSRAVRWYEFDLGDWPVGSSTPSLAQTGEINVGFNGTNPISTFFPAIAPNRCGQTALVMASTSVDSYASIMVTGHDASDPADTMLHPQYVHVGTTAFGGMLRWGDYFMVTPDPNYGGTFWAIGMFTVIEGDTATKITRFTFGPDTDSNGIADACQDCNTNGVDDVLDLTGGTSGDCNTNGFPDDCETAELMGDCNTNGVPDSCDIAAGTAADCDSNGIPDVCDFDCNNNNSPDACEIAAGTAADCNNDGAVDECSGDCNTNSIPDACDIHEGTSADCDNNGIPDECELGPQLFVDVNVDGGEGDGTTWTNAFPSLQDALKNTASCRITQLWVANGTYKPDQGASQTLGDRDATFTLVNGLSIYGGFAGGETQLSQRDVAANEGAILSGDVGAGELDTTFIVTASTGIDATAILDGFTITGGRAESSQGAGLRVNSGASPTIRQCTFEDNQASNHGGAVYLLGDATFEDCTFLNNMSSNDGGAVGALFVDATFTNCTFLDNSADDAGGAMFIAGGDIQLIDSFLGTNGAGGDGGAIFTQSSAEGTIDGCTFVANSSLGSGGGILLTDSSDFAIGNSFFGTNGAAGTLGGGGGIGVFDDSDATIFNCVFSDNIAAFGGGVDVLGATAAVVNATFSRNQANIASGGGGLENSESDGSSVVNCVFRDNRDVNAALSQIAMVADSGQPTSLRISHSNIEGGMADIDTCGACDLIYATGNIDASALFIDPDGTDNRDGTEDDNLRLMPGSPNVDAGSNGAVAAIAEDFDGLDRVINGAVDMGAFEMPLCRDTDVNCDGVTSGLDVADIQAPLNWAMTCTNAFDPRTDVNRDNIVSGLDVADVQAPLNWAFSTGPCICVTDVCRSGESLMGGGESSMMSLAAESESETSGGPWTFEQADIAFELRPAGGGGAVTVLEPHTSYAVYYDAESDAVTGYILAAIAATADEGLDSAAVAGEGTWSDTGRFAFVDVVESHGELITAPGHPGLYRTDWVTDTAVLPGESGDHAPSSGLLHTITTGDAGDVLLELSMYYRDEGTGNWVDMVSTVAYEVEDESE